MNATRNTVTKAAVALAAATPAWAADSATVYDSGPLILAFLGLCALVVVAQFAPVAMLLVGLMRAMADLVSKSRAVPQHEQRDGPST